MTTLINQTTADHVARLQKLVANGAGQSDEAAMIVHALYDSAEYWVANLVEATGVNEEFATAEYAASVWLHEPLSEYGDAILDDLGEINVDIYTAIDKYVTDIQEQGIVNATRENVDFTNTATTGITFHANDRLLYYVYTDENGEQVEELLDPLFNKPWGEKIHTISRQIADSM